LKNDDDDDDKALNSIAMELQEICAFKYQQRYEYKPYFLTDLQ